MGESAGRYKRMLEMLERDPGRVISHVEWRGLKGRQKPRSEAERAQAASRAARKQHPPGPAQ